MQKALIVFLCLFTCQAFADTCPKALDVQHHALKGWRVYDSDTDELVPADRAKRFETAAKEFALAELVTSGKKKGAIHCYYRDTEGSNFESYLAKDSLVLGSADQNTWYAVSGAKQCAADISRCTFTSLADKKITT